VKANGQQAEFLSWRIAPARLNATQAAWYLGFEPHEIAMLVGEGLLKPLGHPARNSTKYFATQTLDQLRRDEKWLARATDAIADHWRRKRPQGEPAGAAVQRRALRRAALRREGCCSAAGTGTGWNGMTFPQPPVSRSSPGTAVSPWPCAVGAMDALLLWPGPPARTAPVAALLRTLGPA
jgi:hypothetical protein